MKNPRSVVVIASAIAVGTVALAVMPFQASNYVLRLATTAFMYVALASSWNMVGGFIGYPSFATAAFFGLGAYAGGILRSQIDAPLPVAWVFGALIATVFAIVIGMAILRLRGHYFAVGSLVLAPVLREIVNSATFTGGGMGLNLPGSAELGVQAMSQLYYAVMLACAVLTVTMAALIARARLGWAMRCIQQNEDAAIVLGIDTSRVKVAAFAASALTAGLTGAIYATWIGYIDPIDVFDDMLSVTPVVMVFLGGIGTILGPVVGAVAFMVLEETLWRNFLNFHAGLLGIVIVALLLYLPGGLTGLRRRGDAVASSIRTRFRRRPAAIETESPL